ncbi:MAG: hypothetical protein JOY96_07045, partial [Verrucomicrobia bacterium]|nr:hypothetical protein [Verrucomicrobiota bacterium]
MVKSCIFGLAFVAFMSALCCAQTVQDIYLAIRTDGKPGSGQSYDPYDAGTAGKYDQLLQTYSHDTAFHYYPGTYQTTG